MGIEGIGGMNDGSLSGITDASGGATAAEAALAKAQDTAFADVLQQAYDEKDKEKLREVCDQFESIMMSMMYKGMKATVPESSFIERSNAQDMFDDMLDDELMKRAGSRGVGLADMLYKQLSRQMDRTFVSTAETTDAPAVEAPGTTPGEAEASAGAAAVETSETGVSVSGEDAGP